MMLAPRFAASRMWAMADSRLASGSEPMLIWTKPTLYLRAFSIWNRVPPALLPAISLDDKANPGSRDWPEFDCLPRLLFENENGRSDGCSPQAALVAYC